MAKVTSPNETFKSTKRLAGRLLLKNRREGITVTHQALTKKMLFFKPEDADGIKTILQERWNNLAGEGKQNWEDLGENVLMDGETLFKQEEKKSMTQSFYGVARYGATKYKGQLRTIYD